MKNTLIKFNEVYLNDTSIVGSLKDSKYYGEYFDYIYKDELAGESSYEKGEVQYLKTSLAMLFKKINNYDPELFIGGDLTNQLSISNQVGMQLDASFIGIYSACSSLVLSLILVSTFITNRIINNGVSFVSSNYGTSERQFRYPLFYGNQRKDASTITTTGAVSCYLSNSKSKIRVVNGLIGKVENVSWTDALDMGSPMAFGAYTTLKSYFEITKTKHSDYDLIVTGDLSTIGSQIFLDLFKYEGIIIENHFDCGKEIYKGDKKYFSGGSGGACIGLIGMSYIKKMMEDNKYKKVIFIGTGSLHSKTSVDQKEEIPIIAHLIYMEVVNDLY